MISAPPSAKLSLSAPQSPTKKGSSTTKLAEPKSKRDEVNC